MLSLADFDFELPTHLIAQHPAATRTGSRLLQVANGHLHDRNFADIGTLLQPGDLLVLNDTRVIKARFYGQKTSGGHVEVLLERILSPRTALAQVRASKTPRPGSRLRLADAFEVCVGERQEEFFSLELAPAVAQDFWQLAETYGHLPLPPYIEHAAERMDESRYQTVYARNPGAVAAPTAGLHFDESLLAELGQRGIDKSYISLHVGAGTFQPIRVDDLGLHRMHREHYEIPAATAEAIAQTRQRGGRIIAVGTTSLRALEASTASQGGIPQQGAGETDLFITPGYKFKVVDVLLSNFHLPRSTLLVLVSAFAGTEVIRRAYAHAIRQHYRFFSYGDAMLLERAQPGN